MNRSFLRYLSGVVLLAMPFALAAQLNAPVQLDDFVPGSAKADVLAESPNGIYVIRMIGDPVVAYEGGIKGLKATKPKKGKKINPNSAHVVKYVEHLNGRHAGALKKVGGGQKVYDYNYSFNGFAAKLSHGQAKKLQSVDGVVSVEADSAQTLDTATTPGFLGLTEDDGLWDQLGGIGRGGEDIIIGLIDGGVWPESLSFTDRTGTNGNATKDGKLDYHQIPGWHGKCTPGFRFTAADCNQKLIGARYYNAAFGGDAGISEDYPWEFASPRDYGGHGTHTASTAGGNYNTPLTGASAELLGSVSGIAPRARIAVYKTCWQTPDGGSCFTSDSVAAVDQAVADGVDVINYSISGTRTNLFDSIEIAFLYAADAGIFVAASAGNSGPTASTVAHPSPWVTTVAASTHDRYYEADMSTGDGDSYTGASTNASGVEGDLVYSADVGQAAADSEEVRLCYPGTLDPALVTGKIVLCDRGIIARVDKSLAVSMAGGIGSILANANDGDSLNPDLHSVPTVHVAKADGDAIRAYATGGGAPIAEIFPSAFAAAPAPFIAGFSSRGPLRAADDMLKPDLAAPGVDIMAAVAPPGNGGEDFASYGGTSMASPHVAGLGALLKDLHPDWSPMMIKSALMTTGTDLLAGPDPFAQGAGHVDPNSAADPGLVYDHGWNDWLDFLFGDIDPSDMNVPSIAIGVLPGSQTVTRTVTNVGDANENYEFSASVAGVDVSASPSSFTIAPGQSVSFDLTFTATSAPFNVYASGFVYWTGDLGHVVRSPVVVRPTALLAPASVDGVVDGNGDGTVDFPVIFYYDGTYNAALEGIAEEFSALTDNVNDSDNTQDAYCFGLPAFTHLRFATRDADVSNPGEDDLDLRLFYNTGCSFTGATQIGSSGGVTSEEVMDVADAPAGVYIVVVDYYFGPTGSIDYSLNANIVSGVEGGGSVASAPAAAVDGEIGTVTVDFDGLNPGGHHLGVVIHENADGEVGRTLIEIDP